MTISPSATRPPVTTPTTPSAKTSPETSPKTIPTPHTAKATTTSASKLARLIAIFTLVAGSIMLIAGAATWVTVESSLADERITVSEDSPRFANDPVDGPLTAYQEAQMIEQHYLESTEGLTYAELAREDPLRQTAMTASFLRASLFTSVVSFGVAAMAAGMGVILILLGLALQAINREVARTA